MEQWTSYRSSCRGLRTPCWLHSLRDLRSSIAHLPDEALQDPQLQRRCGRWMKSGQQKSGNELELELQASQISDAVTSLFGFGAKSPPLKKLNFDRATGMHSD